MASLLAKERMAGQVQAVYMDPPYGIDFKRGLPVHADNADEQEGVRCSTSVKCFADRYRDGVHSYLDGLYREFLLARDLLTPHGSLFVQIGRVYVHRLALVLDEVFGEENRVTTISFSKGTHTSRMSLQVARSTKLTESSMCCIVAPPVGPALMSRSPAWRTRHRPVSHRRRRWRRGAPQLGDGAEESAPVAVEERDDAPHGNCCPGKRASIGCSEHRGRKRNRQAVGWRGSSGGGLLAPAATGGQCAEVVVGRYSTLRQCISASSSRSW